MPQPPGSPDPPYQLMLEYWKTNPKKQQRFENQLKDRTFS